MDALKSFGKFKSHKNGNTRAVTIPKSINLPDNQEYELEVAKDNTLIYRPILNNDNPWLNESAANYDFQKDINELEFKMGTETPQGKEKID